MDTKKGKLYLAVLGLTMITLILVVTVLSILLSRPLAAQVRGATPTLVPTAIILDVTPSGISASIHGRVWHDLCAVGGGEGGAPLIPSSGCVAAKEGGYQANGLLETTEPGLGGVLVQLGTGACPASGLASTITNMNGSYNFTGLSAGTYCVSVDSRQVENVLLLPGSWTSPAASQESYVANYTVVLLEGEQRTEMNFGWDYQFLPLPEPVATTTAGPLQPTATETPLPPQPTVTATPVPPQPTATATPVPSQPTATATGVPASSTPTVGCTDKAAFITDVTIPDGTRLLPGQSFVKTWRLRNDGTCTWTTGYALVFAGGSSLSGPAAVPFAATVAPGSTVDLSVTLTAPSGDGTYESKWQLRNANNSLFGIGRNANSPFWVKIVVGPLATATPTPPVISNWRGEYYGNRNLSGDPVLVRDDAAINFDWGTGAPTVNLPADSFSVRWTRIIYLQAGAYRFETNSDDGIRVWLDGELIIDQWRDSSAFAYAVDRTLGAAFHSLRVEYYENWGTAKVQFWWERQGDYAQWRGAYHPNSDLSGVATLVRNDPEINFNWGRGAPATGLPSDSFSARWTRAMTFEDGLYRFYVAVDDGARLWVDDVLVVDTWQDGGLRRVTGDYRLAGGYHNLRVEYYERGGDASIQVWWEKINVYSDWRGEYWPNRNLSGSPTLVRNDVKVDFDWGRGAPATGLPADDFSARWTRTVGFDADTYRFRVVMDDGARLWVDDRLVIDAWRDGAARELTVDLPLVQGQHSIRLEYYERGDSARIRLGWEKVSVTSYPDWKGEYWSNTNLSGNPTLVRNDKNVDFSWGKGAPAVGLPVDNFAARWSRQVSFESGIYVFKAQADDGIRFYLDGKLVLDEWHNGDGRKLYSTSSPLTGSHKLVVEYYEAGGEASIKFWWEKVGEVPTLTPIPNHSPVAVDDATTTDEDKPVVVNVLTNDSDPDGDPLTVSGYSAISVQGGTVSCTGAGACTYNPPLGFNGGDGFTYTVSDGKGGTDSATVTVTVNPVNDLPVAVDDAITTDEDKPVVVNVLTNDGDPDGDRLTVSGYNATSVRGGAVSCTGAGACTYNPPGDFNGSDSFTYTISDGKGGTDSATVTVTVKPVNDPPVAVDDATTTDQDKPVVVNVLANDTDPDGDSLIVSGYSAISIQGGTVSCAGAGACTYNPLVGFNGSDSFNYTVSDGKGGTDSATVTVTVNPVAGQINVHLNEILSAPGAVTDWDGDGTADNKDEWIELFNAGDDEVNLQGWSLVSSKQVYVLPQDTILNAGAFLVLYLKQTGIILDDAGGQIRLLGPKGGLRDSANYPSLGPDASYSRDELGIWHSDWPPSPGRVNTLSGPTELPVLGQPVAQ